MNDDELRAKMSRLRPPAADPQAAQRAWDLARRALEENRSNAMFDASPFGRETSEQRAGGSAIGAQLKTWRDWLWPSPWAWGVIAMAWTIILSMDLLSPPVVTLNDASFYAEEVSAPFRWGSPYFARNGYDAEMQELRQLTKTQ